MLGKHPMNIFKGRLVDCKGSLVFEHPDFSFPIPPSASLPEKTSPGNALLLGIRPEDLVAVSPGTDGLPSLTGQVVLLEPLGAETYVTLETGATRLAWLARGPCSCRLGDRLELGVAPEWLYFFGYSKNSEP